MHVLKTVFATSLQRWNHPRRVLLWLPIITFCGFTVGYVAIPHFVESRTVAGIATALFGGLSVLLGGLLLAVLD
jgi:hypothetical protein